VGGAKRLGSIVSEDGRSERLDEEMVIWWAFVRTMAGSAGSK
jgi:hypothetical protein